MVNIAAATEVILISLLLRRFFNLSENKRTLVIYFLCFLLLSFNMIRYAFQSNSLGYVRIPVEFSAVAYFAVPFIILSRIPFLRVWAIYSSLLAGSGYFITFILFGNKIYKDCSVDKIIVALICHGILLFIGAGGIAFNKFSRYSGWVLTAGLCLCVIHAFNMSDLAVNLRGVFMYELIYGFAAVELFGKGVLPVYYLLVFAFFALTLSLFYKLNDFLQKNNP